MVAPANKSEESQQPPGPAADAQGRSAIDPSLNVIALNEASTKRLDDLRQAESKFLDAKIQHLEETAQLRADYNTLLREAESKRIDAIRAVDVAAVQRAAEVSATQAQTLATQVSTSAEALRAQVSVTQTAAAAALSAALDPIQKSIEDLRRAQYEQVGQKSQVVENRSSNTTMISMIAVGISILILLIGIGGFLIAKPV